ncbi:ihibitor of apoptosis (iap) [Trichoplusia ni single nucleopolyhedrovirus]|uniref:Ihibitor of apoptosis (Iap) n=1 Tax=Trichoplusia ni single nucleopolyhedrovirus TaxID=332054 RepID=Q462D0_9ABAC|nr:ihibitor of apoptosis (iap) [Trichoplusia ni single nucleopolyhedrovirus]AAZ67406.1 ihibitor of apoptosis (iap) [Trichoplusia ni single nucleopolyhedrovirus]
MESYEHSMQRFSNRLKTFDSKEWINPYVLPIELAMNGFYYLGSRDQVRCAYCKIEICNWQQEDVVERDHKHYAPQCPFIKKLDEEKNKHNTCELNKFIFKYPNFDNVVKRINSFRNWPRNRTDYIDLAEAGFFYTGLGDRVKCFYEGCTLSDWSCDRVPWQQHARWFPNCRYVLFVKGRDYVQRVISESCVIPAPKPDSIPKLDAPIVQETASTSSLEDTQELSKSECKICFSKEINACYIPCGHVVACIECAWSIPDCPICRKAFTNVIKIYFG